MLLFASAEEKWHAIVQEVERRSGAGQPVLVGTRSIDKSETLAHLLTEAAIEHHVLNATQVAREAEIVARAGQVGRVTVATNMAGRGTDIKIVDGVDDWATGRQRVLDTLADIRQQILDGSFP